MPKKQVAEKSLRKEITKVVKNITKKEVEVKYLDTASQWSAAGQDPASVTSNASLTVVTMPSQGTTGVTRIGDQIYVKSLQISLVSEPLSYSTNYRVMFIRWLVDDTAEVPVVNDILDGTGSHYGYQSLQGVPYNTAAAKPKYQVLYDRMHNINLSAKTKLQTRFNLKINKRIDFQEGTQTGVGNIYCLLFSDLSVSSNKVVYQISRVYYTDQ